MPGQTENQQCQRPDHGSGDDARRRVAKYAIQQHFARPVGHDRRYQQRRHNRQQEPFLSETQRRRNNEMQAASGQESENGGPAGLSGTWSAPAAAWGRTLGCGIWDNVPSHLPMKVVVQSSSLIFTLLSIVLNVPITRVKRKPVGREETRRERELGLTG